MATTEGPFTARIGAPADQGPDPGATVGAGEGAATPHEPTRVSRRRWLAGGAATALAGAGLAVTQSRSARADSGAALVAVRLVPQPTAGKLTLGSHQVGELACDSAGGLWFCTRSGTPGTWRKVTLT